MVLVISTSNQQSDTLNHSVTSPKNLTLPRSEGFEPTTPSFEDLCSDLINRCRTPIEVSLKDAELTPEAIDQNVLVGGSTRIPAVQKLVEENVDLAMDQRVTPVGSNSSQLNSI